jgi:hypothetical protein
MIRPFVRFDLDDTVLTVEKGLVNIEDVVDFIPLELTAKRQDTSLLFVNLYHD